jgi:hypothetical protein
MNVVQIYCVLLYARGHTLFNMFCVPDLPIHELRSQNFTGFFMAAKNLKPTCLKRHCVVAVNLSSEPILYTVHQLFYT